MERAACERAMDARLIGAVVAVGLLSFSGVVVETAMNITFPSLMRQFGVGTATVQWITTGYLLVLALIMPASSYLKKRFPDRALFFMASMFFLMGTVLCAIAPGFGILLAGRLIQGVGAGIALPLMFNLILEQAPAEHLGTLVGIGSLVCAMAPAVGPLVGGLIITTMSWRMIFVCLLPGLLLSLILGMKTIRQGTAMQRIPFDKTGYICIAVAFTSFVTAINAASTTGWGNRRVLGLFFLCAAALGGYIYHARRTEDLLIRLTVFQNGIFTRSVWVIMLVQFSVLGLGFLIPNYSQVVSGKSAFEAGLLLFPGCVLGALLAPLSGRVLDRCGPQTPILTGSLAILAAMLCFSLLAERLSSLWSICIYAVFTFGQAFICGPTMANGLRHLSKNLESDGNAVVNTLQQLSGAVGTCMVSTLVAAAQAKQPQTLSAATMQGSRTGFFLLTAMALITFAICVSITWSRVRAKHIKPSA